MSANGGAIRAGAAYVELRADDNLLSRGLKAAEQKLRSWASAVASIGAVLSANGAALSAVLMHGINVFREHAGELNHVAAVTGIGVERLSEMQVAAVMLGGSIEDVSHGLRHMSRFLVEAAGGGTEARHALAELGLSMQELSGMSQDRRFIAIGEAIGRLADPAERAAMATRIFGRAGAEMMKMLTAGSAKWDEFSRKAREMGLVMSGEDAAAAAEMNRAWNLMTLSVTALWSKIGAALAPSMTDLLRLITDGVQAAARWIDRNRALIVIADKAAFALTAVGAALLGMGGALRLTASLLSGFTPILNFVWSALAAGVNIAWSAATGVTGAITSILSGAAGMIAGGVSAIFGLAGAAVTAGLGLVSTLASAALAGLSLAVGFLGTVASLTWAGLTALAGAIVAAAAAGAAGSGTMGIFNAFLAALGLTAGGSSGLLGVLTTAVGLFTGATTVAEVVTGAWIVPLVALLIPLSLLGALVGSAAIAVGLFASAGLLALGMLVPLAVVLAGLAAPVALILSPLIMLAAAAVAVATGLAIAAAAIVAFAVYASGLWDAIVDAATAAWNYIAATAVAAWDWIKDTVAGVADWIVGRARALWSGIVSVWHAVADAAASAWGSVRGGFDSLVTYLGDTFQRIGEEFGAVWAGIENAISANNLSLAMEIVWAGVQVGFLTMANGLKATWREWRDSVIDTAEGAWLELRILWNSGALSLSNIWERLLDAVRASWGAATAFLRWSWAALVDFMAGTNNAPGEGQNAVAAAGAAAQAQQNLAGGFDPAQARAEHEAAVEQRRRERETAAAGDAGQLSEAEGRLAELLEQAEEDAAFADLSRREREAQLRRLGEQVQGGLRGAAARAAAGSFSGEGIAGLVGGGNDVLEVNRRQLTEQEQTRALLAALLNLARANGGLVVG